MIRREALIVMAASCICSKSREEVRLAAAEPRETGDGRAYVQAMVNGNLPPKLIRFNRRLVPLFHDSYTWEEADRAWKAFACASKSTVAAFWDLAVVSVDDPRYCQTVLMSSPNAKNLTVGWLCHAIVKHQLAHLCLSKPVRAVLRRLDVNLDNGMNDMQAIWERLAVKEFWILQRVALEYALEDVDRKISESDDKEFVRGELEHYVATLERLKKPIIGHYSLDGYDVYTKDESEAVKRKLGRQFE